MRQGQTSRCENRYFAKTAKDNLVTLSLISYARKHSPELISLCMGDKGRISRAVAPLLGNYLSFATLEQEGQSAPGQFTIYEMKQINELLAGERTPSVTVYLRRHLSHRIIFYWVTR